MNALEFGASEKWNFINTHRSLKDNKKRTSFWSQIISSWLTSHSRKTDILFFTFHSNECGCGNSIIIYVGPNPKQHLILSAGILTPPYCWGKEVSRIKEWLAVCSHGSRKCWCVQRALHHSGPGDSQPKLFCWLPLGKGEGDSTWWRGKLPWDTTGSWGQLE